MPYRLLTAHVAAFLLIAVVTVAGHAREFTDSAGRRVVLPDQIDRVLTAGPTADALVYALAPRKLIGWSEPLRGPYRPARAARRQVTGLTLGPDIAGEAAIVDRLRPDVVIVAGGVTRARAQLVEQLQRQTGVPCILVADDVSRIPRTLRAVGGLLGVDKRAADLATYAEHAIDAARGRLLIQPSATRPRVYYGRRPDGLETALPGSPAGEAIDEVGAINVAEPLGRGDRVIVTPEQVAAWAPDIIIAQDRTFYRRVRRDPAWRDVPAVREHHVYLEPSSPFGWVDDPPGINRLIGLYWLTGLFYPDPTQEDLRDTARVFYDTFYGIKLTAAQTDAIVRPAVAAHKTDPMEALLGVSSEMPTLPPGSRVGPMTLPPGGLEGVPPPGRRGVPPTFTPPALPHVAPPR